MSTKEPAIRLLRERYSESFAITLGSGNRVHLFLVKVGLWSLVWTFAEKALDDDSSPRLVIALDKIEHALDGRDPTFLEKLDAAVKNARTRISAKVEAFSSHTDSGEKK